MISLGLNINGAHRGGVSNTTYIVFITIMCLGFPFALAVPPVDKVQRTDGRKVVIQKHPSLAQEFKVLKNLLKTKTIIVLIPIMIYAQWFVSYQWQFNYTYFSVRGRALNSLLFYLSGFAISILMGWILDWERFTRKTRAKIGFWMMMICVGSSWVVGMVVQTKYMREKPLLDWNDPGYGLGCFTFLLWGLSDPM